MLNEQLIKGNWTELRGRVKQRWGRLSDDDLVRAEGDLETLVGIIQERSGESREHIEHALDQLTDEYESKMDKVRHKAAGTAAEVSESARQYAERARHSARGQYDHMHEQYDEMTEQMRARYHEAENAVRRKPIESICVAFGAGVMAGLVVGLSLRATRH